MPFTFEGVARSIKNPITKGNYIGIWTDGIGISSDDAPMCAYPLEEGEKYKIIIEMLPSEYCGDDNLDIDNQSNNEHKNLKNKIFLYLKKDYETPFQKFKKGCSFWSHIWSAMLGVSHENFLKHYEENENFASWFSEKEIIKKKEK